MVAMGNARKKCKQVLIHTVENLHYCFHLSWKASVKYTVIRIFSEVLVPILPIVLAFLGKRLLDILANPSLNSGDSLNVIYLLLLMFFLYGIRSLLDNWKQYVTSQHTQLIQKEVSLQQMQHALDMDLASFDHPERYDQLVTSLSDASSISEEIWYLLRFFSSLISFVGTLILTLNTNVYYAIVMAILSVPSAVITAKFTKRSYLLNLSQVNESRKVTLFQNLAMDKRYAQELRLFNARNYILQFYKTLWFELFHKRKHLMGRRSIAMSLAGLLPIIAMGGVSIHLATQVITGAASVGDYSLYTGLLNEMLTGLLGISASAMSLYDNRMKFDHLKEFLEQKNEIVDGHYPLVEPIHEISFEHVSFRYKPGDKWALRDISFTIKQKGILAIAGLNGSGKSTLVKLMLRFYDPTDGRILVNGIDIREITLTTLRKRYSVYFQGMSCFPMTIRENFLISGDHADYPKNKQAQLEHDSTELKIMKALKSVNGEHIVKDTDKKLDQSMTRIFDSNGIELSTGQYQKLALARALYREHEVLILDEPTANIDTKSEHAIFKTMRAEASEHFLIWISHSISDLKLADQIMLISEGKVEEQGTHKELMEKRGLYYALYQTKENITENPPEESQ